MIRGDGNLNVTGIHILRGVEGCPRFPRGIPACIDTENARPETTIPRLTGRLPFGNGAVMLRAAGCAVCLPGGLRNHYENAPFAPARRCCRPAQLAFGAFPFGRCAGALIPPQRGCRGGEALRDKFSAIPQASLARKVTAHPGHLVGPWPFAPFAAGSQRVR